MKTTKIIFILLFCVRQKIVFELNSVKSARLAFFGRGFDQFLKENCDLILKNLKNKIEGNLSESFSWVKNSIRFYLQKVTNSLEPQNFGLSKTFPPKN